MAKSRAGLTSIYSEYTLRESDTIPSGYMATGAKNIPQSVTDLGLGDILKAQLEQQTEAARKSALKNEGADEAQMSMSPATQALFGFLNGGAGGKIT